MLQHYPAAPPTAGWEVAEGDGCHLRAQRNDRAFDVLPCRWCRPGWKRRHHLLRTGRPELAGTEICLHDL